MKKLPLLVVFLSISLHAPAAQLVPGLTNANPGAQAPAAPADTLGRQTPSGTVLRFLQAAQAGNYKEAAEYLQMSPARRQSQGPALARKLKVLMDRAFVGSLQRLSTRPEGDPNNGPADQQTIGTFSSGEPDVPVVLIRVGDSAKIWLFSADTLSKVPELYENLEAHQVEYKLPRILVEHQFLGMALWQWAALLAAIPVAAGIGWVVVVLLAIPRHLYLKYRKRPNLHSYSRLSFPLLVFFGAITHRVIAAYLGLPLLPRSYYYRVIGALVTVGFFWFLLRATTMAMQRFQLRAISAGRMGTGTLIVLAERLITALVMIVAVLAILGAIGFNLTTVLAGVGIGGLAIAFAAQKTLENLFGGISVLADEVIRVGDTCKFGDQVGTVEDISLRSTRIRTGERTQVSIPNGALAAMNVENLSRRDKILFNPTLKIRCETSPDQLRYLLAELRRLLYEHAKIEHESARIRFAAIDSSALNLEVFSYILTRDFAEFTAIREDVLLRILEIIEKSGTGLGFPSSTIYMARDTGLHKEKTEAAEQQVQQWRDERQLPFPDFAPADKSAFRGSITYPPPEAAGRGSAR